jgi:TonB-dependent receptor
MLRRRFTLLMTCIFISFLAISQTVKLSGKVIGEKNEPLTGITIKIAGTDLGTSTNLEGRFSLNLSPGKKYQLEFSGVGHETKIVEVEALNGQFEELNIVMSVRTKQEQSVVVTTKATSGRKETVNAAITFQKNTNTVASVVSAETIRRSPDKSAGDVVKRTPGASIQEGKFIIVRGLADRYNQAMLNGILLTSTEPDRKTFSFDLIPAPMIDNIIINKAFVPEYPGEWAGGLIQVNTKDIPSKNFFNVQVGTGFNTQTIGKDFYKDKGGKLDWLGIDDGTRALPSGYTTKSNFDTSSAAAKTAIGKQMRNAWAPQQVSAPLNVSFQANGGFSGRLFGKIVGGTLGIIYNKTNRYLKLVNRSNSLSNNVFSVNYDLNDDRYQQDVSVGALGSLSFQINTKNKISVKSIINVNTANTVTRRNGIDYTRDEEETGTELNFKENTFFTGQLMGEHNLLNQLKLKWYGAFNILDGYIPDQRRILYSRSSNTQNPFRLIISNTLSQQSGSRIYQNLSDYIYTAGGDLTYTIGKKQTLKGGYMLQVKDRLYDAKLFANYLTTDNDVLRQLPADVVFAPENFGNGTDDKFGFDAIKGRNFRYLANTILNAGYLQIDNEISKALRIVWGLRVENYDQLVGSVKAWDPRHTHTEVTDFLPGLNATFKLNTKTNIRLSGSQTVIRPELRELSFLNLYDFELNASVQGNPLLKRTKVTNADLRYELYPRAGEMFTLGIFYKYFNKPIEQIFNEGSGGASTFNFQNPEKATSYGAEVEFRQKLDFSEGLKNFTFHANASYVHSRIKDARFNVDRSLQGQSPYTVNVGLLYDLEKQGLSATVLYNRIGERIYLVGDLSSGAGSPDIYEAPRNLLDFQLSKKIFKNKGELRLNVSDILNSTQYFYQNAAGGKTSFQKNEDAYRFTRKFGTTFSLTFNYPIL